MPYTKEQLVSSEHFQDILSANRRMFDEQVEREFAAMKISGSSANSTPTLRNSDNSVILFEDPDFGGGLNRPNQFVEVQQTRPIMKKNMIDSTMNRDIEELGIKVDQGKGLSVSEFFGEYDRLRDDIKTSGLVDSHQYLVEVSRTYLPEEEDSELVQLKDDLVTQIAGLEEAQDAVQELGVQLQNQIIASQAAQAAAEAAAAGGTGGGTGDGTGDGSGDGSADPSEVELYNAYVAKNESDYDYDIRSYTFDEWIYFDTPSAGNGWDKLRITNEPISYHPDVIEIEYASDGSGTVGYDQELPITFRVTAKGDDSLSYQWMFKESGASNPVEITSTTWSGRKSRTLKLNDPSMHEHVGVLTCKVSDRSGQLFTLPIELTAEYDTTNFYP